jgi:hypothetical protein
MVPNDAPRLVFQLHSPLDMWVSTQSGEVGSTTDEIEGGLYKRIGELQYIEVPATEKSVQVHLTGQKTGSFTFEMERWQDGIIVEKNGYVAVPTATGTKVTAEVAAGLTDTVLKLDHEGDGVVDAQMNTSGEVVVSQEVSYLLLITTTERLSIQKPLKQTLLTLIKSAEYYANRTPKQPLYLKLEDALLNASAELIKLYTKKRYISAADSKILLDMIKALKDKQ